MRAGSLPLYQPDRLTVSRAAFLLAAVLVLLLLAFAVLGPGASGISQPDQPQLLAPFRWQPLDPGIG